MTDLAINVVTVLFGTVLGLIVVYLVVRVATMAALKSYDDFQSFRNRQPKQAAKEG